jgi:hydrophobic/amphiphilic exporter-1 (mainly G- bacteria), HAE1 family
MIKLSISRPVAVTMTYMTIAALGVAAWRNIPIELLPDSDLPRLTVAASLPGSSPEVMEAFVTSPMESAIQQVRGVEKITSTSTEGNASINIEFAIETDMEFARLELSERIAALEDDLPTGVRTFVQQYIPDEFQDARLPLMSYTLTGPYTQEYLREWATETLDPELRQLEGVGNIVVNGGRDRILEVALDENRIRSLGLSPQTVQQRVSQMEFVKEAGAVETENGLLRTVALRERAETPSDILELPVLFDQGRVVRISDVGSVRETFDDPTQYYRIDGYPAVTFYIWRAVRSNAVATADRVKEHIAGIERSFPSGVRVILDQDQSKDIRAQLSDLRTRAIASAVIVLLVLLLFLRSVRAAVVVFATVAFSVLITMNIMYFAGFTLNLLTLMGLAMGFGLVVDNAIVVLENTYRRRRSGDEAGEAARRGATEVVIPILAATGTTVVVLIPFVYLQGELRIFYVPLAIVVGIALLASLFVAFTFIPSLGARLLGAIRPVVDEDGAANGVELTASQAAIPPGLRRSIPVRLYAGLIRLSLARPWITVAIAVLALGGSFFLFNKYVTRGIKWGGGFGENKDRITISILQPRGEELERTDELARFFESRLRQMPEVEKFVSDIRADRGTINVYFPDSLQYSAIPPAIKEQMVQYSLLYGGTDVRVTGYGPSFYGGGGGSSPNYAITVLGYNYEQVRLIAEDIGHRLERFSKSTPTRPATSSSATRSPRSSWTSTAHGSLCTT